VLAKKAALMFIKAIFKMNFFSFHKYQQVPFPLSVQRRNQKEIAASLASDRNIGSPLGNFQNR
jgi:hypothetical protein